MADAKELRERFDQLSNLWKFAEDQLKALNTPVHCEHKFSEGDGVREYLGWTRVYKDWRLCYGIVEMLPPAVSRMTKELQANGAASERPIAWRPMLECTLDAKIRSVDAYPAIRDKVLLESNELLADVVEASRKLLELTGPTGEGPA